MPDLTDNTARRRFEMIVDGQTAYVTYSIGQGHITLLHTQVPVSLAGRYVGSSLVQSVLETVRDRGLKVVAECDFAAGYIKRHPEFASLVADDPSS